MKLFQFLYREDFGDEWDFYFLKGKERSFFHFFIDRPLYPQRIIKISFELGSTQGLRFDLDLGIIFICKSFFGRNLD